MSTRAEKKHKNRKGTGSPGRLSAWMANHQLVAVESLERLFRDLTSSLLTWFVIGIALALPVCLLVFVMNIQQLGTSVQQASNISLYLEVAVDNDSQIQLASSIDARSDVATVQSISPEQALQEFREGSGFGDTLSGLSENPLPPVIVVTPATSDAQEIEQLASELEALDGVAEAQLDLKWVQRLVSIMDLGQRVVLVLGILLGVGVVLVIGNTIRLAIQNRKDEIVIVKLVGGTNAYVSRPFLYTGLWYGVGGGVIAILMVLIVLLVLMGPVADLRGMYEGSFRLAGPGVYESFLLVTGSGLLGWLGAMISVFRHLRAIEPR